MLELSHWLKFKRKAKKLSIDTVIYKLTQYDIEISPSTLYGYENGVSMPNAYTLLALCDIYGVWNIMEELGFNRNTQKFDTTELNIISKYRTLDERGKKAIENFLNYEFFQSNRDYKQF